MDDRYDVYDSSGRRVGFIRRSIGLGGCIVLILCVLVAVPLIFVENFINEYIINPYRTPNICNNLEILIQEKIGRLKLIMISNNNKFGIWFEDASVILRSGDTLGFSGLIRGGDTDSIGELINDENQIPIDVEHVEVVKINVVTDKRFPQNEDLFKCYLTFPISNN
jgi:hypothetical protein